MADRACSDNSQHMRLDPDTKFPFRDTSYPRVVDMLEWRRDRQSTSLHRVIDYGGGSPNIAHQQPKKLQCSPNTHQPQPHMIVT